ncbi:MAG: multiprotein bridging factor aMBF1 [Desulfurococcales archaeon]|nr:multiprotein bridging factor aMBF1 [Desulfurococcales archaeon]
MARGYQTCELCGRPIYGKAYKVVIEGAELTVCASCYLKILKDKKKAKPVKLGEGKARQITTTVRAHHKKGAARRFRAENYDIVEDYAARIREARQRLGIDRAELARRVQEREVTLGKIETGRLMPTIELARRLERVLRIKLLEPVVDEDLVEEEDKPRRRLSSALTLGDVAVLKKDEE